MKLIPKSIRRSILRWTYVEGVFFALMVASSEAYALLHFTRQGLNSLEIALMSTLPLLFGAITQFLVPRLLSDRSVGPGVVLCILIQILGIGVLIDCARDFTSFTWLLTGLSLYWIGGQTCAPLWLEWIGKLTDNQAEFASYLGKRNTVVILLIMVLYFILALLIDSEWAIAFTWIFTIGLIARLISFALQLVMVRKVRKLDHHKFMLERSEKPILPELPTGETLRLLHVFFFWTALFRLSVNISAPFFLPYMVSELKLTTVHYALLTAIPLLGRALFMSNWTRGSDGTRSLWGIQLSCLFIAFAPAMWTLSSNLAYLAGLEFLNGVFWGGFELMGILMVQYLAPAKARSLLGLHMAAMTVLSLIGALIGAGLMKMGLSYHDIFLVSTVSRLAVACGLIFHAFKSFPSYALSRTTSINYLSSVLSLRPTIANINRILIAPERTKPRDEEEVGPGIK
jgi:MFS family permease